MLWNDVDFFGDMCYAMRRFGIDEYYSKVKEKERINR